MIPSSLSASFLARLLLLPCLTMVTVGTAAASGSTAVYRAPANTWVLPKTLELAAPASPVAHPLRQDAWSFSPNVAVDPGESGQQIWSDVAIGPDGRIAVAWMSNHTGEYHIYYSQSFDGGLTWSNAEQVDDRTTATQSKFVDIDFTPSGIPVAVWEDDRYDEIMFVYLSKRVPGPGYPWTPAVRVNTTGAPPFPSYFMNPSIAVYDDDRYFVAWTDWREGPFHQVYMRSTTNGGTTWGVETRISDGLGYEPVAGDPCLICDRASAPSAVRLSCVTNDWRGNVPGGRYPNVFSYQSTNGGATWTTGVQVNDIEPNYQQVSSHSLCLLDDGTLSAGWMSWVGSEATHYRVNVSEDAGATWQSSVQVDEVWAGGVGTYNAIGALGNAVYAVMRLWDEDWDIYFRSSPDGGRTWPDPMFRVDDDVSGASASSPVVAASSSNIVHVAWSDSRGTSPNWKIYSATGTRSQIAVDPVAGQSMPVDLWVAPNPGLGQIAVRVTGVGSLGGAARLRVFDSAGRCLNSWRIQDGGVVWDGRDKDGRRLAPGTYWLRLDDVERRITRRVVRLP